MNKTLVSCLLSLIILFCGSICGCSNDDHLEDIRNYMKDMKKSQDPQVVKLPLATTPSLPPVTYKADTVRAPFHLNTESASSLQTASTPLQAFPLSVLKFVGTSTGDDVISAYILTPNNMIFQVRKGDAIGEHYGKIISIQSAVIEIEEHGTDDDSKESRIVVLQLKDNNG